jgi:dihydrofolate reductase
MVYMSMSLDGFVASDREHPGMAIPEDADLKQWKLQRISRAGAHLMGRVTYQEMVLGTGQALFNQLPRSRHLNLVGALPFPNGVVVHTYRPQHT